MEPKSSTQSVHLARKKGLQGKPSPGGGKDTTSWTQLPNASSFTPTWRRNAYCVSFSPFPSPSSLLKTKEACHGDLTVALCPLLGIPGTKQEVKVEKLSEYFCKSSASTSSYSSKVKAERIMVSGEP